MPDENKVLSTGRVSSEELAKSAVISDDFFTMFSNFSRVAASATEFRFFFGESFPTSSNELKTFEHCNIVMTLTQGKAFFEALATTIKLLETSLGHEIPTPQALPDLELGASQQ